MQAKGISRRAAGRLKDEVYRQMLRLEAQRPAAPLLLALALLQAWMRFDHQPADSEARQWLRTVSPVCLRMIEAACRTAAPCCSQEE